ncbi:MAG: Ldh family oxidoreductase [Lentisphaeria bacterium]|nr:Ldh family oxidoreductase [Lentisphaeria bacterium]
MIARFEPECLKKFAAEVFQQAGIPAQDAEMISRVLVTTDMRGVHSHGVVRAARYIDCIQAGGIKSAAELEIIEESASHLRVSAAGGLGIPASVKTTEKLIEKAKQCPIAVATVNHSDHYGAAGYYAMRCAEEGLIGFSMSNTCPLAAVSGGASAGIGNNPFAYACPAGKYRAILFDVCMSVVASGKIEIASKEHKKIPFGWILDKDGNPTDDPDQIYNGAVMLPFGGHKGYGIAAMVEMMTALLGNSGLLSGVKSWNKVPGRDSNTGHCFMAINPAFFGGLDNFVARTEKMIDELKAGKKAEGTEKIFYPGEIEFAREAEAFEKGVPLSDASLNELKRAAELVRYDIAGLEKCRMD